MKIKHYTFILLVCSIHLIACSSSKKFAATTRPNLLSDSNLLNAHVGISIYDPSTNKYLYTHQADKYFIPASNTKLFTCYAAMKHLGDSLVGLRYQNLNDSTTNILATADPTFLLNEFQNHHVLGFLKTRNKKMQFSDNWQTSALGFGWAWDDYNSSYMVERSSFPVFGNVVSISIDSFKFDSHYRALFHFKITPSYFKKEVMDFYELDLITDQDSNHTKELLLKFRIKRDFEKNTFRTYPSTSKFSYEVIPFRTNSSHWALSILYSDYGIGPIRLSGNTSNFFNTVNEPHLTWHKIHSQPTDSLLKPMMHRSDNFFAEQTLLMVSNEMTGVMNDTKIIDSLLKTDLKDLPQKPRWVDGSGLSRYNLFSPNDIIHVLSKIKNEFDWNRITTILPTGGEGTLSNYYINLKDKIFAKTGTLSNNIALSGYLITKQNKTLIFSVLVNNHMGNTTQIRRAVEKFLSEVAEKN